ncbi:MAG: proprotein convertase P-domain-containing protein [Dokdonella sp.]
MNLRALCVLVCGAAAMGLAGFSTIAAAATFPGIGAGPIPDNNPAGLNITFNANGLTGPVGSVSVGITMTHTYLGDLRAELISPAGVAQMVVFGRTGMSRSSTFGTSNDVNGTFAFSDDVSGDFWTASTTNPVPPGTYLPSATGSTRSNAGGCATSLKGVFGDLTAAQGNGTWTLKISDNFNGDTGSVGAATLTIGVDRIFRTGFDTPVAVSTRCLNKVQADFTGDGLTDYVLTRPVAGVVHWTVQENLGNGTGAPTTTEFDLGASATDFVDTIDIDGDRIADAMVWTPATGTFLIRRSSRPSAAPLAITFGQVDDDPINSGDYDGDMRDDLAVYRQPSIGQPAGPLQLVIRNTASATTRVVALGTGANFDEFVSAGFDYTGNAMADIAVQRTDPMVTNGALYTLLDGRSGSQISQFPFEKNSDFVMPGNYVGNGLYDITASRTETIAAVPGRSYYTRDTATGIAQPLVRFGVVNDVRVGGDYDGDGLSDYAIWRPSATVGMSQFQVRLSTNTATVWTVAGGVQGDFPVAGSKVK